MSTVDLSKVMSILEEVEGHVANLQGIELDETSALTEKGAGRRVRAIQSQQLSFVANRLELAASLVRIEYWHARGEVDPLNPDRED